MSDGYKRIINELLTERMRQRAAWGTDFDDRNTPNEWAGYINAFCTRNLTPDPLKVDKAKFREDLVMAATLALAAIETIDRAPSLSQIH